MVGRYAPSTSFFKFASTSSWILRRPSGANVFSKNPLTPPAPVVEKPKKAKSRKTTTLDEDLAAAESESLPPPPKAKRKKQVVWQDPFAQ